MPWVRLDDEFCQHPKILTAGPLAMALQVAGLCYASRYLTDGFVPAVSLPLLLDLKGYDSTAESLAKSLVEAGIWAACEGGYQIHDYLEFQPSRTRVLADREAAKERMVQQRAKKRSPEVQTNNDRTPSSRSRNVRPKFANPDPDPDPDPDPEREREKTQGKRGPGEETESHPFQQITPPPLGTPLCPLKDGPEPLLTRWGRELGMENPSNGELTPLATGFEKYCQGIRKVSLCRPEGPCGCQTVLEEAVAHVKGAMTNTQPKERIAALAAYLPTLAKGQKTLKFLAAGGAK
ncbi:MAG: hypothetical protein WD024_01405 [Bacillota bacterium]